VGILKRILEIMQRNWWASQDDLGVERLGESANLDGCLGGHAAIVEPGRKVKVKSDHRHGARLPGQAGS
jgi:hypothetical protein